MPEAATQFRDASLLALQKSLQIHEQRPQYSQQHVVLADLIGWLEAAIKPLACDKTLARLLAPSYQPIERGQRRRAKATRKPRARQAQRLANCQHTHRCQPRECLARPAQRPQ